MASYQLKIHLLSDLCVSDGGVYNSIIDTDCCHDELGFPFIPAKRIKGCLRECALELNDWGKNIDISGIFGEGGRTEKDASEKRAKLRIGNAYLQGFEAMRAEAANHSGNVLYHPQQVLDIFTSLRTQTAITQETGIADPHSLRTMRTVNKGLVFVADVEMPSVVYDDVKTCCAVLQQMGVSRTRGFGDVDVSIVPVNSSGRKNVNTLFACSHAALEPDADYLDYEITLEESVICKSIAGGETRTQDYIEGSKILGIILEKLKKNHEGQCAVEYFLEKGRLRCTNAYIGCAGKRFTEVPAYIYSIKNNKEDYVDRRFRRDNPEGIQLSQMKHCYVMENGSDLLTMDVNLEERYHHKRPDDKSYGRAVGKDDEVNDNGFYQMSSIMAGQKFYGRIYGSEQQIKTAYSCLTEPAPAFLGYGRSSEYGKTSIRVLSTGKSMEEAAKSITGTDIVIKLNSPAIIYNDRAMCSVDREDLVTETLSALRIDRADVLSFEMYANFTTLGGFNVTWGRRKPTIPAFDKGTAVSLKLKKEYTVPDILFVGERCMEGYGEAVVLSDKESSAGLQRQESKTLNQKEGQEPDISGIRSGSIISCDPIETKIPVLYAGADKKDLTSDSSKGKVEIICGSLGEMLADRVFQNWLGAFARIKVQDSFKTITEKYRPTISNLLTSFDEFKDLSQVEGMVIARYKKKSEKKEEKLRYAREILTLAKDEFEKTRELFCKEHSILRWDWTQEVYSRYQLDFLRELLIAMKLRIRSAANAEKQEG